MIQVRCPICNNRLFDVEKSYVGMIEIKCNKCRKLLGVKNNIKLRKIEFSYIMS
ncbi:hypothetical protein [Clostridium subterminale]|uniref:Com family DNA-binding transcriptional regulator n=1 Tax=Clostridium subterminale TaxID=1550 RepID=A0ABN1KFD2_CLOSU